MKSLHRSFLILLITLFFCQISSCQKYTDDPNLKLWYDKPAKIWEEALPLGNGKTGAAKQSLIHRGDISTGWSMAWKINWWARLEDGDHAHKILKAGLTYIGPKNPSYKGGGTYPNLFDGHPPFQIDGNFGGTAGITEMLLQSYDGMITLLPALPAKWSEGEVKGLRAKGGFTINMEWTKDNISKAIVLSELGGNCRIRTKVPVKVLEMQSANVTGENPNPYFRLDPVPEIINNSKVPLLEVPFAKEYMIDFMTEKGKSYTLIQL